MNLNNTNIKKIDNKFGNLNFAENVKSAFFWAYCACLLLGGLFAWYGRKSEVYDDGLSYIDMASEACHHGLSSLINGYWSPGYPALICCLFKLFNSSPKEDITLVHILNYFIFIFSLSTFSFFLKNLLQKIDKKYFKNSPILLFIFFSFLVFIWFEFDFIGLTFESPDLLVSGFVFLYSGFCLKLSSRGANWKTYVTFGIVLALGYYVKTILLILGIILIVILYTFPPIINGFRKKLILTTIVFIMVSLPLIIAVSVKVGHLSISDVGPLSYYWYVHNLDDNFSLTWTNPYNPRYGIPLHSPEIIFRKPIIFVASKHVIGTFPFWYDPSYWFAGIKNRFNLGHQISAILINLKYSVYLLTHYFWFFIGVFTLIVFTFFDKKKKKSLIKTRHDLWLLLWPVTAIGIYTLVHVEKRFLPAFFVVFWLIFYNRFLLLVKKPLNKIILWVVLIFTIVIPMLVFTFRAVPLAKRLNQLNYRPEYEMIADDLNKIGLKSNDRIASVGLYSNYYFAHLDNLHVTAQIIDENDYSNLSLNEYRYINERLRSFGIKAIVSINRPIKIKKNGWQTFPMYSDQLDVLLLK